VILLRIKYSSNNISFKQVNACTYGGAGVCVCACVCDETVRISIIIRNLMHCNDSLGPFPLTRTMRIS